jgi:hypothetical protein
MVESWQQARAGLHLRNVEAALSINDHGCGVEEPHGGSSLQKQAIGFAMETFRFCCQTET